MIDYNALITAGLKNGATLEEIANGVSKALNDAKLKQEDKKEPSAREEILTHFEEVFNKHYESDHVTLTDISALLTLCVAQDTGEGLKMNEKELEAFFDFACEYLANSLDNYKIVNKVKAKRAELRAGVDTLEEALREFLDFGTNRKDEEKPKCACGKHERASSSKTDEETIEEFLKKLFGK